MKTQIFTLAFSIMNLFTLNSEATSQIKKSTPNQESIQSRLIISNSPQKESLSIEEWMTDENYWKHATEKTFEFEAAEKEEQLQIQSWMTNASLWYSDKHKNTPTPNLKNNKNIEQDKLLSIEN